MYRNWGVRRTRDNAKRESIGSVPLLFDTRGEGGGRATRCSGKEKMMRRRAARIDVVALFLLALFAVVAAFHFSCTS